MQKSNSKYAKDFALSTTTDNSAFSMAGGLCALGFNIGAKAKGSLHVGETKVRHLGRCLFYVCVPTLGFEARDGMQNH
jgi:hypothetical protein